MGATVQDRSAMLQQAWNEMSLRELVRAARCERTAAGAAMRRERPPHAYARAATGGYVRLA